MTISATAGRGRLSARLALLGVSTILGSGIIIPASALAAPPSVYKNIDENGVDLTDGSFNFTLLEGSVGDDSTGIALRRYFGAGGELDSLSVKFLRTESGTTVLLTVQLGNARIEFSGPKTGTTFTDAQGTGATLTQISASEYQFVGSDGSTINFAAPTGLSNAANQGFCDVGHQSSCGLVAVSARRPNGAITTYLWDAGENCTQTGIDRYGEPIYSCAQFWRQRGELNSAGYRVDFSFVQETNPATGLPPAAWYKRAGANFYNNQTSGAIATVSYAQPSSTVTQVTDTGGRTWQLTRDSNQYLTGIRRPGSTSDNITISRNTSGAVSQVVADGVTTNYTRSVVGSTATTTATNALSQQTVVVSDLTKGRPTSVTDPLGHVTSYTYDANSRLTQVTAPEGNATTYTFDARGNVTQQQAIAKAGSGLAAITVSASYPSSCSATTQVVCNQPTTTTDARGNVTDYAYDGTHGGLLSVTAPAGPNGVRPQTRYTYTSTGGVYLPTQISQCRTQSSCTGSADEQRTTIGYNSNLQPSTVTVAAGNNALSQATAYGYDPVGNLITIDGPLSGTADTTRLRYDAARQRVGVVSPDPDGAGGNPHRARRTTYRPDGLVSSIADGTVTDQSDAAWAAMTVSQSADTGYDANARPVTSSITAASTTYVLTQTSYDALGRPDCTAQRMNASAFGSLPASACSLGTTGSYGPDRIVKATYDAAGQQTKKTSAYGTSDQSDDASVTYTNNGQVATATDAEGNKTSYTYDGFDRLSVTALPSPTKGAGASNSYDYEQLGYDAAGNVTSRRLRDGTTIAYSYDALNRLAQLTPPTTSNPDDTAITYSYDNVGHMLLAAKNATNQTQLTWDVLGRKIGESNYYYSVASQYDDAGRRTRLTWQDGLYVTYDYDTVGQMTAVKENGSTTLATYSYDALGRRSGISRGNGVTTVYGYDAISRLTSLSQDLAGTSNDLTLGFGYNPANQIASRTSNNDTYAWTGATNASRGYTSNGLNQYSAWGSVTPTYDARGNLTSAGGQTYQYTALNRLTNAPGIGTYYGDSLERLAYIQAEAVLLGYDGSDMTIEVGYSGSPGAVARRYVYGAGVDEPLIWYEGSGTGTKRWLQTDERGSVVAATDAAGSAVLINRYDEHGVPATTNQGRFGFTGQAWLPSLGINYYKARMYSPSLGRFMQTDPIGYADGMNWYNHAGGDPVNGSDPSGLSCFFVSRITGCGTGSGGKQADGGSRGVKSGDSGGGGGPAEVVVVARRNPVLDLARAAQLSTPGRTTSVVNVLQKPQSVCSRPLTGTANRGQTVNSRRAQIRRELAELTNIAVRTGGRLNNGYSIEVGRISRRLAPGGDWIRGGTSKEDGNILFGAATAELGIPLSGATGFGDVDELIDDTLGWVGIRPYDGHWGPDSQAAKDQMAAGAGCPG